MKLGQQEAEFDEEDNLPIQTIQKLIVIITSGIFY